VAILEDMASANASL